MRVIRPAGQRGHANHGWLDTWHTFSFADYHDPAHMGFRGLRVINDDRIAPGTGFGMHGHRDMEIISWIAEGAIEHHDNLGHGATIRPGEVQVMSAGRGILHSEANPGPGWTRLIQIWIVPTAHGGTPGYTDRDLSAAVAAGGLVPIATRDGKGGSLTIRADADVFVARLPAGGRVEHRLAAGRHAWIQVVSGRVDAGGTALERGDGLAISDEPGIPIAADPEGAEVLLFDLG